MSEPNELVFVYGTLRRGERNHHLLANAKLLHEQSHMTGSLYDTGCGYPAVILTGNGPVYGEVYEVNEAEMRDLDELEDYVPGRADNHYERVRLNVNTDQGAVEAWVYVFEGENAKALTDRLASGDWVQERLKRENSI